MRGEKKLEDNQMWNDLLTEAKRCERQKQFSDCTDLASELMMYYLKNEDEAKKAFEKLKKGNSNFIVVDMKDLAREQRKKKVNLEITADMQTFAKIRNISEQYEIAITEDNAFKFHKILKETGNMLISRNVFKIANIIYLFNNSESKNVDKFRDVTMMNVISLS